MQLLSCKSPTQFHPGNKAEAFLECRGLELGLHISVEYVLSMHKTLGSIPSHTENKQG